MRKDVKRHLSEMLDPLLQRGVEERIFPAVAIGVSVILEGVRQRFFFAYGAPTYERTSEAPRIDHTSYFDLASLTKPLATALSVLLLVAEGGVRLEETLSSLLQTELSSPKKEITLRHLLCHASGLAAYQPYFRKLATLSPQQRVPAVLQSILTEPLAYHPCQKSVYSDLGFLLLGFIIERKSGLPLDLFVEKKLMHPFGLESDIFFNRLSNPKKDLFFVPTENCFWREKMLRGEVHDDNAFCLDGVAGHAGLFGNVKGVLTLTELLLDFWQGRKVPELFSRQDVQRFLSRQTDIPDSTWALGFDTPNAIDSSSGHYFSPLSVGHLGFTGTSFWIDPERDLAIVVLTNRVYPDRGNTKIKQFRPIVHDRIMEGLALV